MQDDDSSMCIRLDVYLVVLVHACRHLRENRDHVSDLHGLEMRNTKLHYLKDNQRVPSADDIIQNRMLMTEHKEHR